ncbi:hypothetical protein ACFWPH_26445 [Nocardia sp. NPDC058499]|uniref:hypothetical protein n=1 Tax=Nocardia sp. NPDC058499 TaxID=3346530 RepID=UPI00365DF247
MAAVARACDHSRILVPSWQYGCTRRWAEQLLPDLRWHGLQEVATALGTRVERHYHAGPDASTAADIALALATRVAAHDLPIMAKATGTRLESFGPGRNTG